MRWATAGLDKALHSGQTGRYVEKLWPGASPSKLVGSIASWFLFLGAISLAVSALKIAALTTFVSAIYAYRGGRDTAAQLVSGAYDKGPGAEGRGQARHADRQTTRPAARPAGQRQVQRAPRPPAGSVRTDR